MNGSLRERRARPAFARRSYITTSIGTYKRSHSGVKLHWFTVAVYLFEKPSPHPPPVADFHLVYAFLLRESSRFLGLCNRPCAFYHRKLGQLMSGVTCLCNSRFFELAFFCFAFFALLFFVIKRHLGAESLYRYSQTLRPPPRLARPWRFSQGPAIPNARRGAVSLGARRGLPLSHPSHHGAQSSLTQHLVFSAYLIIPSTVSSCRSYSFLSTSTRRVNRRVDAGHSGPYAYASIASAALTAHSKSKVNWRAPCRPRAGTPCRINFGRLESLPGGSVSESSWTSWRCSGPVGRWASGVSGRFVQSPRFASGALGRPSRGGVIN